MSRRSLRSGVAGAALALAVTGFTPSLASAHGHDPGPPDPGAAHHRRHHPSGPPYQGRLAPQVVHTGTGPTGYEVTFRYYDPSATSVRIRGEWFFSSPSGTTTTTSQGLLPAQWAPGDFPIAYPNQGATPNWPVSDMSLDRRTGIWSFTTPLPSGTFTYGFYVNCTAAAPALTGCTELSDPSNPPWNQTGSTVQGSVEPDSEVYVPSDPRFGTPDLSWQQPHPGAGQLLDVSYPDPQSTSPVGSHPLAVFLPPGYDPHRSTPYPTLYLSHGAGGNEVDWSTQGAANSILVNLMAEGKVQPMVMVMTNFNDLGSCGIFDASCYRTDLADNVVPFVQSHFDVSPSPADRAFGGLSAGGLRGNDLLFNDTDLFGYYGIWSIGDLGAPAPSDPLWTNPDLRTRLGIQMGGGIYDSITETTGDLPGYEAALRAAGIPFTDDQIAGGHEWYTWRQLLYDYLTRVAFRTTTTSVAIASPSHGDHRWSHGRRGGGDGNGWGGGSGYGGGSGHGGGEGGYGQLTVTATVTPATTEEAAPTGTVQFSVDGHPVGSPVPVQDGTAQAMLPGLTAADSVTAAYSGDSYYNPSTSTAATLTAGS
jgi:hypothetical protein